MRTTLLWLRTSGLCVWPNAVSADPIRVTSDARGVGSSAQLVDVFGNRADDVDSDDGGGDLLASAVTLSALQGRSASAAATLSGSLADPQHMSGTGTISAMATLPSANSPNSPARQALRLSRCSLRWTHLTGLT
jgi:hypothetical protein